MIWGWLPGFSKKEIYYMDIQEFILQKEAVVIAVQTFTASFWTSVRSELLMVITAF
jgi:hypothetical protein